jgi:elongation factor G
MKQYDDKHIKNIALIGAPKSGKTTLAETMLFEAGIIDRRGKVEDHNTVSDYHEIEHEREGSVYATTMHTEWRNYKINIIDTPGYDDFIGEVITSLRISDTSIMLINAHQGVEVGTDLIWRHVEKNNQPVMFAINQLDHPNADFNNALEGMKEHFGSGVTVMQYPLNAGEGFNKIIDLLKMKMYVFGPEGGKPEKHEIPQEEMDRAMELHNELVEKAAENDDALMELFFDKGTLNEDEMRAGIKMGMLNHDVFPVFCLSALNNMGSGRMMGFIDNVVPAAAELSPEKTIDGKELKCDPSGPTALYIFKTFYEKNLGKMSIFKVMSGEVKQGDILKNFQTSENEHLNQLFIIDGKTRHPIEKLTAGDIGATLKLKNSDTNQTLSIKGKDIGIAAIEFPASRIRTALLSASKADDEKLGEVLKKIKAEDPTLLVEYSKELKQLILSCQGALQLNLVKWTIENRFGVKVEFDKPRIPYRETIRKGADKTYRHKKQSGGAGQFGEVSLRIEPWFEGMPDPTGVSIRGREIIDLDWGGKLEFINSIVGGAIDARFLPAILKGVLEKMEEGPITGSYVRDVRVVVYDGKMHPVDSNEISFKLAGLNAFKEAFLESAPQLLEPIYNLQVMVPEDLMGDVMTDLQTRRSIIMGIDAKGRYQVIKSKTPLAELDKYSTTLRSITHGKASFSSEFAEYAIVPREIQDELAKSYREEEVEV